MKNQKLLDALKTIKKYCQSHDGCDDGNNPCPFLKSWVSEQDNESECMLLSKYPSDWHPWQWITDNNFKENDMDRDYGGF